MAEHVMNGRRCLHFYLLFYHKPRVYSRSSRVASGEDSMLVQRLSQKVAAPVWKQLQTQVQAFQPWIHTSGLAEWNCLFVTFNLKHRIKAAQTDFASFVVHTVGMVVSSPIGQQDTIHRTPLLRHASLSASDTPRTRMGIYRGWHGFERCSHCSRVDIHVCRHSNINTAEGHTRECILDDKYHTHSVARIACCCSFLDA
jgi:hypothetical protein